MANLRDLRFRAITTFQRRVANPIANRLSVQTLLETTGRVSGLARTTPIGGKREGGQFWFVSEFGEKSQYIRNINANNRVRLRLAGRWYEGTAHPVPQDDARARLLALPRGNSAAVRLFGDSLLTVRVDLDD